MNDNYRCNQAHIVYDCTIFLQSTDTIRTVPAHFHNPQIFSKNVCVIFSRRQINKWELVNELQSVCVA